MDSPAPLDLNQERSVAEIVRAALVLYRRHPALFWTLALAVIGPYDLIVLASTGHAPLARSGAVPILADLLDTFLAEASISALHIHAVAQIADRRQPRLVDIAVRGLRVLPVVAATLIMSTIGIFIGFLLLILPGIFLALRWAVAAQAAAIENAGWQRALARSRELTRDNYVHVLALTLLTALFAQLIGFAARQATSGHAHELLAVAGGILIDTIVRSFAALTSALLFFDLRARYRGPRRRPSKPHERPRDLD